MSTSLYGTPIALNVKCISAMFSGKVLCCPFNLHAVVYELINGFLIKSASRCFPAGLSTVTVTGLKPETDYEVKMSAINGKGEGDSSPSVVFKTEHVREYPASLSLRSTQFHQQQRSVA